MIADLEVGHYQWHYKLDFGNAMHYKAVVNLSLLISLFFIFFSSFTLNLGLEASANEPRNKHPVNDYLLGSGESDSNDSKPQIIQTSAHQLTVGKDTFQFTINQYVNRSGERELEVVHHELPKAPGLVQKQSFDTPVLIGRDLDGDGRIDLWFWLDTDGTVQQFERKATTGDAWETIQELLVNQFKIESHGLSQLAGWYRMARKAGWVFMDFQTFNGSIARRFWRHAIRGQMDLIDLETRADRLYAKNPDAPEVLDLYKYTQRSWNALYDLTTRQAWLQAGLGIASASLPKVCAHGAERGGAKYIALERQLRPTLPWLFAKTAPQWVKRGRVALARQIGAGLWGRIYQTVSVNLIGEPVEKLFLKITADENRLGNGMDAQARLTEIIRGMNTKAALSEVLVQTVEKQIQDNDLPVGFVGNLGRLQKMVSEASLRSEASYFLPMILPEDSVPSDKVNAMVAEQLDTRDFLEHSHSVLLGFAHLHVGDGAVYYRVKGQRPEEMIRPSTKWTQRISVLRFLETSGPYTTPVSLKLVGYAIVIQEKKLAYLERSPHLNSAVHLGAPEIRWIPVFRFPTSNEYGD